MDNEAFGDVKVKKYNMLGIISSFDLKEETVSLTSNEVDQRKDAQTHLARVILME